MIDAMNRRDLDAYDELAAPDFEWSPGDARDRRGRQLSGPRGRSKRYLADYDKVWEDVPWSCRRNIAISAIAWWVLGRLQGHGEEAVAFRVNWAAGLVFQLQGGKISRVRGYLDHGEALRAAGLSE